MRKLTEEACFSQGWMIFEAFQTHARLTEGGYASVLDVDELPVKQEDRMETFWIVRRALPCPRPCFAVLINILRAQSETLKYLYLLFSEEDQLPLSKYVFNTEAHPLPVFTPTVKV